MHITMAPATAKDALEIAAHARQADIVELWASGYTTPLEAMMKGIDVSDGRAMTGFVNGEAVCMWGIADGSMLGGVGVPWMIGSEKLDKYALAFLRRCSGELSKMAQGYDILVNWVDARNTKAIEWLRWLGFEIRPAEPHGFERELFHQFWMKVNHV